MSDPVTDLVTAHLKQLRLPAMARELERLSREAAASNQNYEQFLLRLSEAELAARSANALEGRIKSAAFPVAKDFDTYDFSAMPTLSKPKLLELALCEWIDQRFNCCFIGSTGTGKPRPA
jgi:DNA replication protein DnaC